MITPYFKYIPYIYTSSISFLLYYELEAWRFGMTTMRAASESAFLLVDEAAGQNQLSLAQKE